MNSKKNNMEEITQSIVKNTRNLSYFVVDTKIEKISSGKRKTSFSKGAKDKEEKKFITKFKDLFAKKIEPGIKGLKNIGATCYMNATLQCFSNSDKLKTDLINKYDEYKKDANTSKKLTFALAEVVFNLWEVLDDKKYIPEDFKRIIGEMNPLFKKIGANDPKDLILFILIKIHDETNTKKEANQMLSNTPPPNPYDFYSVYNDFQKYYNSNNSSIISNEFYGCFNSMTTCLNCKYSIHNIQSMNILFFPLEEVRKFKNHNVNEKVSIIECFEYYEKYDMYPSYYCNICRYNCPAYSITKIINCPKTLIINLNRGRGIEFDVKVTFEEYLDLQNFIINPDSPNYYELKGVISHFGSNDEGGHFIAFCKNTNNCNWYKFNDEMVEKCSFKDVLKKGMPYVLFYSHVNT
jgi:ubiquitin carboxyl-terminal hydrolase 8